MSEHKSKNSVWSWRVSEGDLKNQVDNYSTLKITESYRGISVLIMVGLLALSLILSFLLDISIAPEDVLWSLIVYIPILFFVYKGHRWAIVALMILWTIEQALYIYDGTGGLFVIFWWFVITPYFYRALKVENERRRLRKAKVAERYCGNCGTPVSVDSKFCQSCGAESS